MDTHPSGWNPSTHYGMCGQSCPCCRSFVGDILGACLVCDRLKTKKNEPRVCDIDIIDFKGLIINKNKLQIPHSKLHVRNFVLYPLREIEPNWTHPVFNKKIDYFLKRLNLKSHIEITRLKKSVIL